MTISWDRNDKLAWILIVYPCILLCFIESCDAFNTKLPLFGGNANLFFDSSRIYDSKLKATDNEGKGIEPFCHITSRVIKFEFQEIYSFDCILINVDWCEKY